MTDEIPEEFYCIQVGRLPFWTVRSAKKEWPENPAYEARTLDDVLLWMIAKEVPRVEVRIEGEEQSLRYWLARASSRRNG